MARQEGLWAGTPRKPGHTAAPVAYRVSIDDPHAHLFAVTLTLARPLPDQQLSLPAWIPGSYLVREFSRHLQELTALQAGQPVALRQLDKCTWQASGVNPGVPLQLRYRVYALGASVHTAWLCSQRGFFNGTSLLLRVHGQEQHAHVLEVADTGHAARHRWQLATGLTPIKTNARGFGRYQALGYDDLVDCPVEMGAFWSGQFTACGVPHRFVVAGAPPSFDGQRLLADARRICETAIRLWHPRGKPPFDRYLFMLNAVKQGYGGLEHHNSTALICHRADLPRLDRADQSAAQMGDGYLRLLSLISHEYFHAWNIKRLRPAEFARYDYARENYTRLLWFFEGLTSYYDDLLLRRAQLIDDASYLRLLAKSINHLRQTPGRRLQSVAQASFDAWVKYYRPDENTPNATISYYTKGALVALCLDLTLRAEGRTTLDEVMRGLWQRCAGGPMTEADLLAVLHECAGRSLASELAQWVHGTDELPLKPLLEQHGVRVQRQTATQAQRLGLRVREAAGQLIIESVLHGSLAQAAGFAAGDEWLAVQAQGQRAPTSAWRLSHLDDLPLLIGPARRLTAWIARDQRLLCLPLRLPSDTPQATNAPLALHTTQTPAWMTGLTR